MVNLLYGRKRKIESQIHTQISPREDSSYRPRIKEKLEIDERKN